MTGNPFASFFSLRLIEIMSTMVDDLAQRPRSHGWGNLPDFTIWLMR
jgi:hypothetical protein